jgi:tetratricopeptide (TPR) repeat protein
VANVGTPVQTRGGGFEEGLANGRKLLERHPAIALQQAEALLRSRADPRLFELAAASLRRLGREPEAEQAELSGIRASFAVKELDRAAVAAHDGRGAEARTIVERFLGEQPDNLLALTMAAELDIDVWQLERSQDRLGVVLDRAPAFLRAIMLLAKSYSLQARLGDAIHIFEGVVRRKPNNIVALRNLAQAYSEANQHEKAAKAYGRILEIESAQLDVWIIFAQELRMLGRKEEAQAAFRRALALDPNSGAAWWGIVNYFPEAISGADVEAMERALAERSDSAEDGGPLHVALGIIAERRGNYEEAFRHISEGKQLRAHAHPYNAAEDATKFETVIRTFTPELFASFAGAGSSDNSPIFVIGMPRSGTTLLERILSRHSQIEARGELPIIARLAQFRSEAGGSLSEGIHSMSPDQIRQLGETYVERAADYRTSNKPRFIDKMNSNWFRVGLIRLMLPNARIIDLRRDALDCCWSNFKMMFAEGSIAGNDQRDIAIFYRNYVHMIEAVDAAAPGGILRARYEELVDDVEDQTRRILDFLDLDYEPACVDFHLSTEAVATPSSEQVRRPINRDSIGSSLPYREWLGPMIEELGELADQ